MGPRGFNGTQGPQGLAGVPGAQGPQGEPGVGNISACRVKERFQKGLTANNLEKLTVSPKAVAVRIYVLIKTREVAFYHIENARRSSRAFKI